MFRVFAVALIVALGWVVADGAQAQDEPRAAPPAADRVALQDNRPDEGPRGRRPARREGAREAEGEGEREADRPRDSRERREGREARDGREPREGREARDGAEREGGRRFEGEGPGRPGGADGPFRRRLPELTEEQAEEYLTVIKQLHPDLGEALEKERQENPERFRQRIREHAPRMQRWVEMRRQDADLYELYAANFRLERSTSALARSYREALQANEQDKADRLRRELADDVERHFDVRQKLRERELQQIEERLERMRQQVEARQEARSRLIEDRIHELTGQPADRVEF